MTVERVEIGTATLYLGDCLAVLPTLEKVEAVVTDPPYGVRLTQKTSDYRHSSQFDHGASLRASRLYDDDPAQIAQLVRTFMPHILRVATRALIFCGASRLHDYPKPNGIGCVYTPSGAGRSPWGFQCCHPILYYGKDPFLQRGLGSRPNSFHTVQPNREKIDHPCPKPIEWMLWAVKRASFEDETILDPFMGSGTTGVACVRLGRPFIGIEIERRYFDIACQRIEAAMHQTKE